MHDSDLPIWNPFREGYLLDPHAQIRVLREQNPVHKGVNGRWILFKHEDVKWFYGSQKLLTPKVSQALADKSSLLNGKGDLEKLSEASAQWMLFQDPPDHTEMRSIVSKIWRTYDLKKVIHDIVDEGIDQMSELKKTDIVAEFATFVPARVMCAVLGLPPEDHVKFKLWSHCLNSMLEPFSTLYDLAFYNEQAKEFYEYLDGIIESKKTKPDEKFISRFIDASETFARPLNRSEIISVIAFLFFAGIETSVNLFGQSVLLLIEHPDQTQLVRDDPSIAPRAVEELLRFISPSQYTTRVAAEDIELRGKHIAAGDYLMGSTTSANRDPEVFDDPERLDLTREKNPHLAFGYGMHFCVGAKLARDELTIALPAFVQRFPNIRLDPEKPYEWDKIIINRGLKNLPVILD